MWDPGEYQRFAGERGRPFFDLLARVRASDPRFVVDLGCGPGNLTAALADRWPRAEVVGVDNSAEMIGALHREGGSRSSYPAITASRATRSCSTWSGRPGGGHCWAASG